MKLLNSRTTIQDKILNILNPWVENQIRVLYVLNNMPINKVLNELYRNLQDKIAEMIVQGYFIKVNGLSVEYMNKPSYYENSIITVITSDSPRFICLAHRLDKLKI